MAFRKVEEVEPAAAEVSIPEVTEIPNRFGPSYLSIKKGDGGTIRDVSLWVGGQGVGVDKWGVTFKMNVFIPRETAFPVEMIAAQSLMPYANKLIDGYGREEAGIIIMLLAQATVGKVLPRPFLIEELRDLWEKTNCSQ